MLKRWGTIPAERSRSFIGWLVSAVDSIHATRLSIPVPKEGRDAFLKQVENKRRKSQWSRQLRHGRTTDVSENTRSKNRNSMSTQASEGAPRKVCIIRWICHVLLATQWTMSPISRSVTSDSNGTELKNYI